MDIGVTEKSSVCRGGRRQRVLEVVISELVIRRLDGPYGVAFEAQRLIERALTEEDRCGEVPDRFVDEE